MSRTSYTLQESIDLARALRAGPDAAAYHKAFKSARDLWSLLNRVPSNFGFLVEALGMRDDQALDDALERLGGEIDAVYSKLADLIEQSDAARVAGLREQKETFDWAVERRVELERARDRILRAREAGAPESVLQQRAKLRKAGVPEAYIERLAPGRDPAEFNAELAAIDEESAKLSEFVQSRDPAHLPAGYAAEVQEHAAIAASRRTMKSEPPNIRAA
ncbi:hypothetical protein [Thiocystis violacea]|uniref:hypothetical protein n=1 Tax=Thiocystis violacea TaxID=13725 RepID=UPI001904F940|nr:hypothetical protein [Thiocystis violacea]MBK1725314.1 hypothetical protein [Thiocystis violacea]